MTDDPRLTAYLETMRERAHPFYAMQCYRFAAQAGDTAAMEEAVMRGALSWRPEPNVYAWTEEREIVRETEIIQLRLFEEAA